MKTKIFILLAGMLVLFPACEDFLEETPEDFLSPENLPQTVEDADLMLNGALGFQRTEDLYERHLMILAGTGGDDMGAITAREFYEIDTYTYPTTNSSILRVWRGSYSVINQANILIDRMPSTNLSDEVKEKYVAAAKFLRALYYFHLVRLYGSNCILLDKPVEDFSAAAELEPASIEEVYQLIKEDIDYAVGSGSIDGHRLPTDDFDVPGKPTYGAAKALQAKIYMTMAGHPLNQADKWQTARDAAQEVMDMPRYSLGTDLVDMWLIANENTGEFIYSIQNHLPSYGSMLSIQSRPNGWDNYTGDINYFNKFYEANDLRRDAYYILEWEGLSYTEYGPQEPFTRKYIDINRENLSDHRRRTETNFPVFRMSEVYLMFAEAENEVNGPTQAAHDALNATRVRAGLDSVSGLSKEDFKTELIRERAREFTFEAKRRYDLHRWNLLDQELSDNPRASTGFNMAQHEYFPAPENDALLNPNLRD